jgi:hypothetical protein
MSRVKSIKALLIFIFANLNLALPAHGTQNGPDDSLVSQGSAQRTFGYSLLIGGGVVTWLGVFAGASGGDECSEKTKSGDETTEQCRDRKRENSTEEGKKLMRLKLSLVGIGLVGVGTGLYLVTSAPADGPQLGLFSRAKTSD